MNEEPATGDPQKEPVAWRLWWREGWRQAAYLAVTVTVVALIALALGATAAGLQAGRDEARNADLALIVAPPVPPTALADHSVELYRRGYVTTLLIVGEGQAGLVAQLIERGIPETHLASGPPGPLTPGELRRLIGEARPSGASSMLVVAFPGELLRALKLVRDQDVRAYGSPAPGATADPLELIGASVRYWQYVLLGR